MDKARRLLIIYNPCAGGRRRGLFLRILKRLKALGCEISLYETKASGDAVNFLRATDIGAYDAVVAAGGDGTIREVVNGLAGREVPMGIVPLGTTNVLASEMGLASDEISLSKILAFGRPASFYIGDANGHLFVMMAGIGFDARVIEGINVKLKRVAGKAAYVASALLALLRNRPISYLVEIDGVPFTAAGAIIAKGHYYAGKFVVANSARHSDPILQVALFSEGKRSSLLQYALALATGRLHTHRNVHIVPGREVRIAGASGEPFQLDGDLAGGLPIFAKIASQPLMLLR